MATLSTFSKTFIAISAVLLMATSCARVSTKTSALSSTEAKAHYEEMLKNVSSSTAFEAQEVPVIIEAGE